MKTNKWISRIFNMAAFYGGWLVCIQEAPGPHPWVGPALIAVILAIQLYFSPALEVELTLILSFSALGTFLDSMYTLAGVMAFQGGYACCPYVAPLWVTALWALYGSSVNYSLEWLRWNYLFLAAPLGAWGAISTYFTSVQLGAAEVQRPEILTYSIIGVVWAVVVPASFKFNDWLAHSLQTRKQSR